MLPRRLFDTGAFLWLFSLKSSKSKSIFTDGVDVTRIKMQIQIRACADLTKKRAPFCCVLQILSRHCALLGQISARSYLNLHLNSCNIDPGGTDVEVPELLSFNRIHETDLEVSDSVAPRITCNPKWLPYFHLIEDRGGLFKSVNGIFIDKNGESYSPEVQRFIKKNKATPFGKEILAHKEILAVLHQDWNVQEIKIKAKIDRILTSKPHTKKLVKDVTSSDVYKCYGSCGHVAVVTALRHINPELPIDVTELVHTYHTQISRHSLLYGINSVVGANAIEDILIRANPPIGANVDRKQSNWTTSKLGTRVNWRQLKSVFNGWKKVTTKGKLRGAYVSLRDESGVGHAEYVGFEDDGHYSTMNSMSGRLDNW